MMEGCVISSEVSFSRNIVDLPFPNKLSDFEDAKSVAKAIYEIFGDEFEYISLKTLDNNKIYKLLENEEITSTLVENKDISSYAKNIDKDIKIYINEQDHIKEICKKSGECLESCFNVLSKIDNKILSTLDICYSKKYGFLTSNPKNSGTAMIARVKLFLPALTFNSAIEKIEQSLYQNGLILESDKSMGQDSYFYILSNKFTLGISEEEIIKTVKRGVEILTELEQKTRQTLQNVNKSVIIDQGFRAYGILTNSYILSCEECIEKLSKLRFAYVMGLIKLKNVNIIDELYTDCKIAHLQDYFGLQLSSIEEKIFRAKFVAENLENKLIKGVK